MLPVQLIEWNQTEVDYPRNSTIAELFSQQAALCPDRLAVAAFECDLTYRQVEERSNQLARHLQSLGVGPDTFVGVSMGRSEWMVISQLAILKAGGAYVPLDPGYPQDRLALVIEDSQMRVLVTNKETSARLPLQAKGLTVVDVNDLALKAISSSPVESKAGPADVAYMIYTSGSTGRPKGVMVEHRNVVNFFTGMDQSIGGERGVWLAVTSISFDISVLELLWTLTRGYTVVIDCNRGPSAVAEKIMRYGVTHLQMTPSLALMLTLDPRAYASLASLKKMLLGGEAVPASLVHHLRKVFKGEIHNMYGPTETTIWSTTGRIEHVGGFVSIGKPIANTQVYMLDSRLNPVPVGEVGELFIGGDGVARGYWNRPELTAERFITVPSVAPGRIYRTGDLARFLPDGNIEFLGRADYQIKLRGHRIEPGEIEALLEECPGVRQAVIVLREDREGDKRLTAYVVAAAVGSESGLALRNALEAKLPDYMIPSAFVFLPELPLTDNGKIDRKALLKLPAPHAGTGATADVAKPASEIERIVSKVWQDALGVSNIGMNDNFFDLGAHSLTIAEVQPRLRDALGREVALVDLFQFTTVSALSAHLGGAQMSAKLSDRAQRRRMAHAALKGIS